MQPTRERANVSRVMPRISLPGGVLVSDPDSEVEADIMVADQFGQRRHKTGRLLFLTSRETPSILPIIALDAREPNLHNHYHDNHDHVYRASIDSRWSPYQTVFSPIADG